MVSGLLEAPSGSHSTAQRSCIGLAKPLQRWKNKANQTLAGVRSKIILLGEDSTTVWRPFMVRSRSGQPTLSICNLSAAGRGSR